MSLIKDLYPQTIQEINGIHLNISDVGEGKPIIWAHGLLDSIKSENHVNWIGWDTPFKNTRLIRYDARGHGESGMSANPDDYHWSNLANDMLEVAKDKKLSRFIASGRSMGCATAVYAAIKAPEKVSALLLVNPPTGWATREAQSIMFQKLARLVKTRNASLLPEMLKKHPENQFPGWLVKADPQKLNEYIDIIWASPPERLERVFQGASICDLPEKDSLKSISVPTLILAWNNDTSHPLESAMELNRYIPSSDLRVATDHKTLQKWPQLIREFVKAQGDVV